MSKLVSSGGIFVGCNRQPHVLDWNSQFNVIAFGGSTDISVVNVKVSEGGQVSLLITLS